MTDFAPFNGDGRRMVKPIDAPSGTRARSVRYATARMIIGLFVERGSSQHSEGGSTVWVITAWAKHQGVKVVVTKRRYLGWTVEKAKP